MGEQQADGMTWLWKTGACLASSNPDTLTLQLVAAASTSCHLPHAIYSLPAYGAAAAAAAAAAVAAAATQLLLYASRLLGQEANADVC